MPKRAQALFYLALVILGLVVLSAGLHDLVFQPAQPIPGADPALQAPVAAAGAQTARGISLRMLLQTGLALGFIALLVLLVFSLFRKADLKKLLRLLGGLAAVVLLMFLVGFLRLPAPPEAAFSEEEVARAAPAQALAIAPIGDPPAGLAELVLAALIVGAVALGGWLVYSALRKRPEDALAREAAAALKAIDEGGDLRDVILNCYLQMTRAVKAGRGLEREETMTPREFEEVLRARGVPDEPIRQLTGLFEMARYSRRTPDRQDEAAAVVCLESIRMACLIKRT